MNRINRVTAGLAVWGWSMLAQAAVHLYWQQPETGAAYQHSVGSQGLRAGQYLPSVATPWRLASHGDFNGDGEEDLLWQHRTTGAIAFEWFRDGTHQVFSYPLELNDPGWQLAATGDLDADGKADLIWHHPAHGDYYLWLWDGQGIKAESSLFYVRDSDWQLAFVRDFDGDGNADLLFRHQTSGANYLFSMDGLKIAGQQELLAVRDLNWQLVGAADLNGDNTADLVWRHQQTGQNYGFYLKQGRVESEVALPTVTDLNWQLHSLSDLNGDGQADLLWWHRTRSELVGWVMNGPKVASEQALLTVTPGWQLAGVRAHNPGYLGKPVAVPGRIEAEFYDRSGVGVSFHDSDDRNQGDSPLRNDGVDIEATTDTGGGANIGYIASGEWLKYQVRVTQAGRYLLRARVAGAETPGSLRLLGQDQDLTGPIAVPVTGGWQTWQTIESAGFELAAGEQSLTLQFDTGLFNLNYVELVAWSGPSTPLPPVLDASGSTELRIHWTASGDDISEYRILLNGQEVGRSTTPSFQLTGLQPSTSYQLSLIAVNQAGSLSMASEPLTVSTLPAAPAAPVSVRVTGLDTGASLVIANTAQQLEIRRNGWHAFPLTEAVQLQQAPRLQQCRLQSAIGQPEDAGAASLLIECSHPVSPSVTVPAEGAAPWPLTVLHEAQGLRTQAYPGIRYQSRLGVTGGLFPYEFRLLGVTRNGVAVDTGGFMLDFRRGLLDWTPSDEGQYRVQIEIRDSNAGGAASLIREFPIEVSAAAFRFVSPTGEDSTSAGSRNKPFKTLAYALSQTPVQTGLYLRGGRYLTGGFRLDSATTASLLAYPDEVVTLDLNHNGIGFSGDTRLARIEGFELANLRQYGLGIDAARAGLVVRNNRFLNGREFLDGEPGDRGRAENPAFIFAVGDAQSRHFGMMIQDNVFGPLSVRRWLAGDNTLRSSGGAAMVLYDSANALVENNLVDCGTSSGISDKDNSVRNTFRENLILDRDAHSNEPASLPPIQRAWLSLDSGFNLMAQDGANGLHVHHNLLENSNIQLGVQCFQSSCVMQHVYLHHNTLVSGHINSSWGPFQPLSQDFQIHYNLLAVGDQAPYGTLWSEASPSYAQQGFNHNLVQTSSSRAVAGDGGAASISWADWQAQFGFDTDSTLASSGLLVGAQESAGLPISHPLFGQYGHRY